MSETTDNLEKPESRLPTAKNCGTSNPQPEQDAIASNGVSIQTKLKITLMPVTSFLKNIPEEYWRLLELIGFILAVIGIGFAIIGFHQANISIKLGEQESLERYKQLEPAVLNVTPWVDISDPKDKFLFINITNMAKYKSTGNINIYKLELNPYRPALILSSLGPGENITNIRLGINYTEVPFPIKTDVRRFGFNLTLPCYKTYYVNERESISYKVTCDNCNSEGVVGRIPGFGECGSILVINKTAVYENKTVTGELPVYSWIQFTLEDLKNEK